MSCVRLSAIELLPESSPLSLSLTGTLDAEVYATDSPTPGLLLSDDEVFFNPRATLFADLHLGAHWYGFVQARFDRGFDPGTEDDGDARLDEYFVRWTPFDEPLLNLQVGKFATVFGQWVNRHLSWDNPFITAPAAYENVITITDRGAPQSANAFMGRRLVADKKEDWLTVIWGPAYTSGASVSGSIEKFDYAFEVKNSSISSRPSDWQPTDQGWQEPTVSGRLGFRPDASWNMGASGSSGAYIADDLNMLPDGQSRGDFRQDTLGFDLSYAHEHFQIWSEFILSQFDVPFVGQVGTLTYFIEAKYKFTPNLFAALRWNQQFFDEVTFRDANGRTQSAEWDRDLSRVDASIGYRFNRHVQAKVQYSYGHESGPEANADHLVAAQVTLKF